MRLIGKMLCGTALCAAMPAVAPAADVEVTHWWTSGGEAAAVAEFAEALEGTTDHTWVDGAIAGSGATARPIMISRITGGDPMAAFQFNHGRQAEELIEAGLLRPLTDIAQEQGWADAVNPPTLLDACTVDGEIYCVPVNIHSWQWLWLSIPAFEEAGLEVPTDWNGLVEAAPALREAGIIPLAFGRQPWQAVQTFHVLVASLGGHELYRQVYEEKDAEVARGPEMTAVFDQAVIARDMMQGSNVQEWQAATNLVITDQAAAQIMGDWAQGDFAIAGEVAGEDYACLLGLGVDNYLSTGGDAFYFPEVSNEEMRQAQEDLAGVLIAPETQVAFNAAKGSLPVRGDVNLDSVNDCTQQGLAALEAGNTIPDIAQLLTPDDVTQTEDLFAEFFNSSMSVEDVQERYARIIENAG